MNIFLIIKKTKSGKPRLTYSCSDAKKIKLIFNYKKMYMKIFYPNNNNTRRLKTEKKNLEKKRWFHIAWAGKCPRLQNVFKERVQQEEFLIILWKIKIPFLKKIIQTIFFIHVSFLWHQFDKANFY